MRSFVAINFDRQLKSDIADFQSKLKSYAVSGRWKHIDNFHLTLKFLGEIDRKKTGLIERALDNACSQVKKFRLRVDSLGSFPGQGSLRVLWLSLDGELNRLNSLFSAVDRSLASIGFEKEKRRFVPHVTIGQDVIFTQDFNDLKLMLKPGILHEVDVDRIFLFKSEQIGRKRVYTPLSEHFLLDDIHGGTVHEV